MPLLVFSLCLVCYEEIQNNRNKHVLFAPGNKILKSFVTFQGKHPLHF